MASPEDVTRTQTGADASPPAPRDTDEILTGDRFGRYTVQRLIGSGGMGHVYAAHDTQLGRTIALKLIRTDRAMSPSAAPRLLREAQALALLHHPNVVTVHDIGSELDRVFIAMELVDGPTLSAWLTSEPRRWRDIVRVLLAAGRGLAAAHAAGIIHRDFKPANVIVGKDRVVVVDFGLARAGGAPPLDDADVDLARGSPSEHDMLDVSLTEHGARIGTAGYMAPEQIGGRPVTSKADQFAFCVALWEALWHERPMPPAVGIDAHHAPKPSPLGGVPARVRELITRGLAADPARRWPDLQSLLAALERTLVRRAWIAIAGALVVAAIVVGVIGWVQQGARAERRLVAAQKFSREAAVLRGHMRAAHLLPLHDIEVDRQGVRAEMVRITAEMAMGGEAAIGPGEFALGVAWMVLGDTNAFRPRAIEHLQAAWDAGERSPELAFDLGSVLARQYQVEVLRLPPLTPAEHARREAELRQRLRDPAITYLRQSMGADTSPDYVEALIALTEDRLDDAISHGESALRSVPTLYEAGVIVAEALQRKERAALAAGQRDRAAALQDRVVAMYRRVADTGRSDDMVYRNSADFLSTIAYALADSGRDIEPDLQAVLAFIEQGRKADSQAVWPDEIESRTDTILGGNAAHFQRDPRPFMYAAIAAAERAQRRDPTSVKSALSLGDAWGTLVDIWETPHGLDPRASLEKSIAAYRAANQRAPDPDTSQNLGVSLSSLAYWQIAHGIDGADNINAAVAGFEDAARMEPSNASVSHSNICSALLNEARSLLRVGRDPAAWIARAHPSCDAARHEAPGSYMAMRASARFGFVSALAAARTGGDPEPGWQRAIADGEAAEKLDATDPDAPVLLADTFAARAEYAIAHASTIDAAGAAARAVAEAHRAITAAAAVSDGHAALARAQLAAARVAVHAGHPSDAALAEGRAAAARALAINADDGLTFLTAAELDLLAAAHDAKARQAGLDALARALAINPHDTRALVVRAGFERGDPAARAP